MKAKSKSNRHIEPWRHRPYILSGYRPAGESASSYLRNFFSVHNESFDIWSHGAMFLVMLRRFIERLNFEHYDKYPVFDVWLTVAFMFVFAASTIAHLWHMMSPETHVALFRLDWSMIGLSSNISALCFIGAASGKRDTSDFEMAKFGLFFSFLVCCFHNHRIYYTMHKRFKTILIATPSVLLMGLLLQQVDLSHKAKMKLFELFRLPICVATFGLTCFLCHIPERFFPGKFDMFGHSHNIHHIWSSLISVLLIRALMIIQDENFVEFRDKVKTFV